MLTDFTTSSMREAPRAERVRLHHHLDLADLPARHGGAGHPREPLQLRLHRVVGDVVELLLVQPIPGHGHLDHRDPGDVHLDDEGLRMPGGKEVRICADALGHVELGVVEVHPVLEPDPDPRDPLLGGALHPIHARRGRDGALDGDGDGLLDVDRAGPGVEGGDLDQRDVDGGEEVDRQPGEGHPAEGDRHERHHQDEDGVLQGEAGEPHGALLLYSASAVSGLPGEGVDVAVGAHLDAVREGVHPGGDDLAARLQPRGISIQSPPSTPVCRSTRLTLETKGCGCPFSSAGRAAGSFGSCGGAAPSRTKA